MESNIFVKHGIGSEFKLNVILNGRSIISIIIKHEVIVKILELHFFAVLVHVGGII